MTKSKQKQGMSEICMNCAFSDVPEYPKWIMTTEIVCTKTNKKHDWDYSCKKWEEKL